MFVQDLQSRSISWLLFPFLALCGLVMQLRLAYPPAEIFQFGLLNLAFLIIQYLCIRLYFRLARGPQTKVIDALIGWGDLLFLLCVACILPTATFILFYAASLLFILIGWALYRSLRSKATLQIPLAGLQALILLIFASGDWLFGWYRLFDDPFIFLFTN
ncbi:hypothetical protein CKK33_14555 [Mucilaginibacter sp. MD40]|uniref:hypothetical protein n=1 Tax=Mucilaginibacter sp. MD40 TaxID=2029590 RepID=UPI000BAC6D9E|nr:hypothetical protein [Mucilaginibacter sp. MD40]PAW94647.1 hypothetical protein CKK33_14555 [Mucilaginibacter sp. MD40]